MRAVVALSPVLVALALPARTALTLNQTISFDVDQYFADAIYGMGVVTAAYIVLAIFVFAIQLIFVVPQRIYRDLTSEIRTIKSLVEPRLAFALPEEGLFRANFGSTSGAISGWRQSVVMSRYELVAVQIKNVGANTIENCRLFLSGASRFEEGGIETDLGVVESVDLIWSRDIHEDVLSASLRPGQVKRVYIANVHPAGYIQLWRDTKHYPIEYHTLFQNPGKYAFYITAISDELAPQHIKVIVETRRSASEPNRLPIADADVELVVEGS